MSIEDAKNRLQQYQAKLQTEQGRRDQAYKEQTDIENELSHMVANAVKKSIYSQDTNIDQLKRELHTTNENYQLLHRDFVALNDILSDTTHLQELYNIKHRELDEEYKDKKVSLDRAYKQLVDANNSRINTANAELDDKLKKINKKIADLEAQEREEERKYRGKIEWVKTKMGLIFGLIIFVFIVALVLGWMIGSGHSTPTYTPF